jgi:hypothetical protein
MNERQLIIIRELLTAFVAKCRLNSERNCFQQFAPVELEFELSEYRELEKAKQYYDDLLAYLSQLVAETAE